MVNDIANGFTLDRKVQVAYFAKLVRDNWDGITTVPDEKKKILLTSLRPELAGTDIYVLRTLLLVFVCALFGVVTVLFLGMAVDVWKKRPRGSNAP